MRRVVIAIISALARALRTFDPMSSRGLYERREEEAEAIRRTLQEDVGQPGASDQYRR
jgi:hypothetical protein